MIIIGAGSGRPMASPTFQNLPVPPTPKKKKNQQKLHSIYGSHLVLFPRNFKTFRRR